MGFRVDIFSSFLPCLYFIFGIHHSRPEVLGPVDFIKMPQYLQMNRVHPALYFVSLLADLHLIQCHAM
jgi:hypothetical protein